MKLWKRAGSALLAALALTAMLTGTALASEADSGIAVQLDGRQLSFTDAAPEIANDHAVLPLRAVLEAMGAEVDYDAAAGTVSAKRGGVELAIIPGQKTLTITENGQTRAVEMDVAPYINQSNNRTYIPIRSVAEALGYSVGWDRYDRTVILVDVDALFGGATFTLMDNFSAYCKERQAAAGNMSLTGSLTLDAADKSGTVLTEPLKVRGSLEGVVGGRGAQLTGRLSMTGLSGLAAGAGGSPMEQLMIRAMLELLADLSVEARVDLDSKALYLLPPAKLTGAEDAWYSLDLSAYEAQLLSPADMSQIARLEDAGAGEILAWVLKQMPLNDRDSSYDSLARIARLYADMLGDQAFTLSGDAYTARTTLEDVADLEITLTKKDEDVVALDLTMTAAAEEDGVKLSVTMTEHASPDKVDMVMELSAGDGQTEVLFRLDLSCVPTDQVPETALPAGAQATPLA